MDGQAGVFERNTIVVFEGGCHGNSGKKYEHFERRCRSMQL